MYTHVKKKIKKLFNMFNEKPSLTIKGKGSHKSLLSQIISTLIVTLYLSLLINFGIELFRRASPTVIAYPEISKNPVKTQLNLNNFFFAVELVSSNETDVETIDGSILSPIARFYNRTTYPGKSKFDFDIVPLKMNSCMDSTRIPEFTNYFSETDADDINIDKMLCLNLDANLSLTLEADYGKYGSESFIEIDFFYCKNGNSTTDNHCVRKHKDKQHFLNIYIMENLVDIKNYTYPFVKRISNIWDFLDTKIYKAAELSLKSATILTDDGLLFRNSYTQIQPLIGDFKSYSTLNNLENESSSETYNLKILLSNESIVYKRTYVKIPIVLAQVMSTMKITIILVRFFTKLFTKFLFKEYVINVVLDIKDSKEKKPVKVVPLENKEEQVKSNVVISNRSGINLFEQNKGINTSNIGDSALTPVENEKKKDKNKEKKKKFEFSTTEILSIICLEKSCLNKTITKKHKILKNSYKFFQNKVDLTMIMKKNDENNLILKYLLNKEQENFFKLFKKAVFENENYEKQKKLEKTDNYEEEILKTLQEYYYNSKINDSLNKFDELLLDEIKEKHKTSILEYCPPKIIE